MNENLRYNVNKLEKSEDHSESIRNIVLLKNFVKSVQNYVVKEAYLDEQIVNSLAENNLNPFVFGNSHSYGDINSPLYHATSEVKEQTLQCLRSIADCFDSRKVIYIAELKKLREISQTSARTIVQNERSTAAVNLKKLEVSLNDKHTSEVNRLSEVLTSLKQTIANQETQMMELQSDLNVYVDKERHRSELLQAAVDNALAAQKNEHERVLKELKEAADSENKKMMDDALAYINSVKAQSKADVEMQLQRYQEMEQRYEQEKIHWREETFALKEQNNKTIKQMHQERDEHKNELRMERDNAQLNLNNVMANGVREQSVLKAEMSENMLRIKSEESKLSRELEQKLSTLRNTLNVEHSMNIEKLHEKHRAEMKRYKAELQVSKDEAIAKLKHTHSQEMNRLVRDNERLQRLVLRNGGGSVLNVDRRTSNNNNNNVFDSNANYDSSYLNTSLNNSNDNSFSKSAATAAADFGRRMSVRGFLSQSKQPQQQHQRDSEVPSPPDSFAVDEAYQSTKQGRSSSEGFGISQNAQRVIDYSKELEKYIQQDGQHDSDEDSLDNVQLSQLAQLPADVSHSFQPFGSAELSTEDSR